MHSTLPKRVLLLMSVLFALSGYAQTQTYKGTVSEENTGLLLQGATVTNLSTQRSVITDQKGLFTLDGKRGDSVAVSFVGYHLKKML